MTTLFAHPTNKEYFPQLRAVYTMGQLCDTYDRFCACHDLPKMSADELWHEIFNDGAIDINNPYIDKVLKWLSNFIDVWDIAVNLDTDGDSDADEMKAINKVIDEPTSQGEQERGSW